MGRNAKIRQQRKRSALEEELSAAQKPSQLATKASSLSKKPSPKQQTQAISFFKRIVAKLNPFPKANKYQICTEASDFFAANSVLLGATAWKGYQKQGKGLVFVEDPDNSKPAQIEYIPQRLLKKTMRRHGLDPQDIQAIDNMLKVYEPATGVVIVYINNNGEMSTFVSPQQKPAPEECYRMMQAEETT